MDFQELQKYELVETFLNTIRNTQSKQEFLSRVQEFDGRFTEEPSPYAYSDKQKSTQKLPPMPQEKPKNPFKTNVDENFRQHSFINQPHSVQNSPFNQPQPPVRGTYSRTEQNFYKNPVSSGGKGDPNAQLNNSFGYNNPNQGNYQSNQGSYNNQGGHGYGGMGVLNYNAYSQKQYDDLKQQFFRPPPQRPDPYAKVQENYASNMRQTDNAFNFNPMGMALGMSSSTQLLGDNSNKPSARAYGQKGNPFMRQ